MFLDDLRRHEDPKIRKALANYAPERV